jgi:histidyl-tRNA synthetase
MAIQAPKGTVDLLPDQARVWAQFKQDALQVFSCYGYQPIETPIFEQTELFVRGIGSSTDVVSKEMFATLTGENLKTLLGGGHVKSNSKFSLRPEGTASVVRAIAQHNLVTPGGTPAKLMYAGPMFRAENVQKGRQRQFNQVGIECLGSEDPAIDAEAIIMLMRFYKKIGLDASKLRLLINSMGCEHCRPAYRDAVAQFLLDHQDVLCEECANRAHNNPLRAFDCKNESCKQVMADAPRITDALCQDCKDHYQAVKTYLDNAGIAYIEDTTLVRGLDYYTRTVFEVQVIEGMGSQNAIGGGGRYDKLMEEIGGNPMSGFGFALGYERCMLALESQGKFANNCQPLQVYLACVDQSVKAQAFNLLQHLRDAGIASDMDHQAKSLKAQFKAAGKQGVDYVLVLGPDELAANKVTCRNMQEHNEQSLDLSKLMQHLKVASLTEEPTTLGDCISAVQ